MNNFDLLISPGTVFEWEASVNPKESEHVRNDSL